MSKYSPRKISGFTKDQEDCDHTVEHAVWVKETCDMYGHDISHWKFSTEYTSIDLDVHRYQCTQCGLIRHY